MLNQLAERLMINGLDAMTPVVVMAGVSRTAQTFWAGSLADLGDGRGADSGGQPVLIAIGQAFAQAATFKVRARFDGIARLASRR